MHRRLAFATPEHLAAPRVAVTPKPRAERLQSLDAFRGLTIAAMILVNNPGGPRTYPALRHSEWNGCTVADLIFAFFLFIVGVAITLSFAAAQGHGRQRRALIDKVVRRTLIIFGLGLFLNAFPSFDWSMLRIPGVLQRIAVCYCLASLLVLTLDTRGQAVTTVVLLLGYWMLMKLVPVPGAVADGHEWNTNLAAYLDHAVLRGHMLHAHWDPEGLLSTLPATATTLAGVLTGHWLRSPRTALERVVGLFVAGNVCIVLGLGIDPWYPINKSLWTSSYVLYTAGGALNLLGMCYWLIDVKGYRAWAKPWIIYGTNPLLAYLLSGLMAKATYLLFVTQPDGLRVTVKVYLFQTLFLPLAGRLHASFLYALAYVVLWLGVMAVLYRKKIFFKI